MQTLNWRNAIIGILVLLMGIGFANITAAQDTVPLDELLTNVILLPRARYG